MSLIFALVRQEIQEPPSRVDFGVLWDIGTLSPLIISILAKNIPLFSKSKSLLHIYKHIYSYISTKWEWGDGCAGWRTSCSSNGPEFSSQDQHDVSQPSDIRLWSPWELTYGTQTYMLVERYTHKIKIHKNHFKIMHWILSPGHSPKDRQSPTFPTPWDG